MRKNKLEDRWSQKSDLKRSFENLVQIFIKVFETPQIQWQNYLQAEVNSVLSEIAKKLGVFSLQYETESQNIRRDLTVRDAEGKVVELVNRESMRTRVEGVLINHNDPFSIIRTLALVNRCAHRCETICRSLEKENDPFKIVLDNIQANVDAEILKKISKFMENQQWEKIEEVLQALVLGNISDISLRELEDYCYKNNINFPGELKEVILLQYILELSNVDLREFESNEEREEFFAKRQKKLKSFFSSFSIKSANGILSQTGINGIGAEYYSDFLEFLEKLSNGEPIEDKELNRWFLQLAKNEYKKTRYGMNTLFLQDLKSAMEEIKLQILLKQSQQYCECAVDMGYMADMRGQMFWIKDKSIEIIGQLLKSELYSDLLEWRVGIDTSEITTNDTRKKNTNVLVINYPELSYYVEVHMPPYLARILELGEGTLKPGYERVKHTAVYDRDKEEVYAISRSSIPKNRGKCSKKNDVDKTFYEKRRNS